MANLSSSGDPAALPQPDVGGILESAPDAIVVVDARQLVVFANQLTAQLFGCTHAELVGAAITALLPEWRPAGAAGGAPQALNLRAHRKDGSTFPVEVRMSAAEAASGLVYSLVLRDSSERERVEEELRASQVRLAGVLEIAEDAIISVDERQLIQRFNHGAEKVFGYTAPEIVGQPLDRLLPQRFAAAHRGHVEAFGQGQEVARLMGHRSQIYGQRKDGSEFPAEASISKLSVGGEHIYTVILRDITERKRQADELERQVRSRTAHLNALLELSNDLLLSRSLDDALRRALRAAMTLDAAAQRGAIYLYDDEGKRLALRASAGYAQLPQITLSLDDGLIGQAFAAHRLTLSPNADEVAIPLLTHAQPVGVMALARDAGGFGADVRATLEGLGNLTAAAIVEEQSRQAAASLSSQLAHLEEQQRTMTERLNYAEAGMLQAARLAAVGQLAASIAHEINNPLYAARNGLYLIEEDLPAELRDSPYLRMVTDQLTRIAGIIERMRDFYRPTRGELAPADVNHLMEETLALAGLNLRHEGINMIFAPARDLPPVLGNSDQLRQVFLNLVLNAIEAMPDGGTLTVRTEAGSTVALIQVQDTGVGIPDDIRAHLFEPFFTSKSNGTGLGLSISAHIVTQHSGQLEVESKVGVGTTFTVVLPYQQKA